MTMAVFAWQQVGQLHVWRYAALGRSRRGWHFHADPAGCASIADLIDRMVAAAVPCHRTAQLGALTPQVWGLPNFGPPRSDRFGRLRIEYRPEQKALSLDPVEDRLTLGFGAGRAALLRAAFVDLMAGQNDFGIGPSDNPRADAWMFW